MLFNVIDVLVVKDKLIALEVYYQRILVFEVYTHIVFVFIDIINSRF